MTTHYTTYGSVRGTCGHHHRTLKGACRCLIEDQTRCHALGGGARSDRGIYVTPGRPGDRILADGLEPLPSAIADRAMDLCLDLADGAIR